MSQDDLAARVAAVGRRPARTPARDLSVRTKPVRVTADLAPQNYRMLAGYCDGLAEELATSRVTHSQVIRALIGRLEADQRVRDAVRKAISIEIHGVPLPKADDE